MKLVVALAGLGVLVVLTGGAILLLNNGAAEANVNRPLLGLWRGIDPVDGSRVMRVFAPTEDGSTQTQLLVGHDTSITTCTGGNDPFEVGDDKATIFGEVKVGNQIGVVRRLRATSPSTASRPAARDRSTSACFWSSTGARAASPRPFWTRRRGSRPAGRPSCFSSWTR